MDFDPREHPHQRYNPLTGEWLLVSPHRTQRPWQGRQESPLETMPPAYDPGCYLCPGNERAGGAANPDYDETFVFVNDFAALRPEVPEHHQDGPLGLLRQETVRGECRVICFSPRHDLTLARMDPADIVRTVRLWQDQTRELGERWGWVQVFENRGEMMGASNPHPHGQIWSLDRLPVEAAAEDRQQRAFLDEHGEPLLLAYARLERERRERIVVENDHWLALVPFWAVWPFETLIVPAARRIARIPDLTGAEREALAALLKALLVRYDNLFETSFPYSMGWHGAPFPGAAHARGIGRDLDHWQLHAHIYPPLLRSATVRKFMVGFEMLGQPQRDLTAEQAAERLRELSETHYLDARGDAHGNAPGEEG